jgi:hypothetical protein
VTLTCFSFTSPPFFSGASLSIYIDICVCISIVTSGVEDVYVVGGWGDPASQEDLKTADLAALGSRIRVV